jgi:hypothetical protein
VTRTTPPRIPRDAGTPRRRALARLALLAAGVAIIGALDACSEFGTAPDEAVSIEILPPELPALVVDDEMRDSTGAVVGITARAFNADDELIAEAPIRYFALDTGIIAVDSLTGRVTALRIGTRRVIAAIAGLQSEPIDIVVTERPDTAYTLDSPVDTVQYSVTQPELNVDSLRVFVGHDTTIGGVDTAVAVPNYLVRYRIVEPPGLSLTDTLGTILVQDRAGRAVPSTIDTTDNTGFALRFIRLARRPPIPDSVVVEAVVSRPDGTPLPGTPIRRTLIVVQDGQSPP